MPNESELNAFARVLVADKYKVEVKTIAVDYGKWSPAMAAEVREKLKGLEIGVLGWLISVVVVANSAF